MVSTCIYVCICIYICIQRETERERQRARKKEGKRDRERERGRERVSAREAYHPAYEVLPVRRIRASMCPALACTWGWAACRQAVSRTPCCEPWNLATHKSHIAGRSRATLEHMNPKLYSLSLNQAFSPVQHLPRMQQGPEAGKTEYGFVLSFWLKVQPTTALSHLGKP